jgi:hypothetical protein
MSVNFWMGVEIGLWEETMENLKNDAMDSVMK